MSKAPDSHDTDAGEIAADAPVDITFRELGLDAKILKALDDLGYEKPTPIQAAAIPAALKQRDVLGIAQTGTGKTGAFTLPTVHKLAKGRARARMPRCLIVCPTRELAAQVAENVELYGKYLKLEMALLIGGVSFAEQDRKLTKGVDILIATPGRLLDQYERGKILMTGVQTLVVDEADRMLDMGFIPDIERIFEMTPFTRQVLFFSATMPNEIKRLVDQFLHQPVTIQVARQSTTAENVTQRIVRMPSSDPKQKRTALRWLIEKEDVDNGIIFCNRKRDVDIVAKSLNKHGHDAAPIHGDLAQSLRTQTLDSFRNGEIKYLVASDVAARGLDVPSVSHVFNYDVPSHSEDYVHRIGRTGRAGRDGDTIMLVCRLDERNYDDILNLIKVDAIDEIEIPGIEDFPKDGGGRRKGRDRKGGRDNRGGRGGRGERSGGHRSRAPERPAHQSEAPAKTDSAPKSEPRPTEDKPAAKSSRASKSSNDGRRRKAPPGRKKPEDEALIAAPEPQAKAPTPTPKPEPEEKPRRSRSKSRSNPRREKSSETSEPREASRDRGRNKKRRGGGRRDQLDDPKGPGFDGETPAFFQTSI